MASMKVMQTKKSRVHVIEQVKVLFSSRRRHTISDRDWSSDVCSSDLPLRAQKFFYGRRKERARFHGRVVRDDHAWNARDVSDAGNRSGGDNIPPLFVHFVSRPEADLEKLRVFVEKLTDSFSRRQAAELALPLESGFPAALAQERFLLQNFATKIAQRLIGRCRCSGHVRRRV